MKKLESWLWGGVLVVVGVILAINALGLVRINIFFPGWWTLFIIVPCLIGLLTEKRKWGSLMGLVFGICLLLSCLDVISFSLFWKLLIPAILIAIGIDVIYRNTSNNSVQVKINQARREQRENRRKERKVREAEIVEDAARKDEHIADDDEDEDDDADFKEYWSTFGDQNVDYNGKTFQGCRVDAVFGGADINLRGAEIQDKAILHASSIFGGIIIYVPEDVKVEIASTAVLGGVSDKRKSSKKDTKTKSASKTDKTLYIEATCIFGSIEIR